MEVIVGFSEVMVVVGVVGLLSKEPRVDAVVAEVFHINQKRKENSNLVEEVEVEVEEDTTFWSRQTSVDHCTVCHATCPHCYVAAEGSFLALMDLMDHYQAVYQAQKAQPSTD